MSGTGETWYAVFAPGTTGENSEPYSVGTVIDEADLAANGYTYVTLSGDPTGQIWNQTTHAFVARSNALTLTAAQFMGCFTQSERITIRASSDPVVQDFVWLMTNTPLIQMNSPYVAAGLTYLSANPTASPLLSPGREASILAGTQSGS